MPAKSVLFLLRGEQTLLKKLHIFLFEKDSLLKEIHFYFEYYKYLHNTNARSVACRLYVYPYYYFLEK